MKVKELNIRKGLVTSLFLIIVGGIIVNSTVFLHTHRVETGKIVFHAHPFDKGAEKDDPLAKHKHNRIDLDYLSSFEQYTTFEYFINLRFNANAELELLSKPCIFSSSINLGLYKTRGPPSQSLQV